MARENIFFCDALHSIYKEHGKMFSQRSGVFNVFFTHSAKEKMFSLRSGVFNVFFHPFSKGKNDVFSAKRCFQCFFKKIKVGRENMQSYPRKSQSFTRVIISVVEKITRVKEL